MREAITEKAVCEKCGVDVRDGTTFCYNCGARIADLVPAGGINANLNGSAAAVTDEFADATVESVKADDANKLSRAADQRRKARVGLRRTKEYIWEPVDDSGRLILVTFLITAIALTVVAVTVFWK